MNICIYGASSRGIGADYLRAGEALGAELARRGHGLVFGGGASGMMGAAARGAASAGGEIIGVAPRFFDVDGVLFDGCTRFFYTDTMRQRKEKMEELSGAFVMLPGSIGTLEEFFEILTLKQLGRHDKPIAVLDVNGYYDHLEAFLDHAVRENFLYEPSRALYGIYDAPAALLDALESPCTAVPDVRALKHLSLEEHI